MILSVQTNLKIGKKFFRFFNILRRGLLNINICKKRTLSFYLSSETIKRSNFSNTKIGKIINLEKSIKYGDEVSGHYTQGHVDTIGNFKY